MPAGTDADATTAGAAAAHLRGPLGLAAAVVAGLAVHLAVGTGVPRLGPAALAVAALGCAVRGRSAAAAASLGLVAGLVACGSSLRFVHDAVVLAGRGPLVAWAALALAVLVHAARFAVAAATASVLATRGAGAGLAAAAGWTLAELVDPAPLPWSLGASTLEVPALAAVAASGGPVAATIAPCLVGAVALDSATGARRSAVAGAVMLAVVAVTGVRSAAALDAELADAPRVRVAAVHGVRGRDAAGAAPVDERRAAARAAREGARLVVLPESAVVVARHDALAEAAEAVVGDVGTTVVVGVASTRPARNAVVVVAADGRASAPRDKRRPFPAGEESGGLWAFIGAPAGAIVRAGDQAPAAIDDGRRRVDVATAVCWDDLFPAASWRDADVIAVAANDGWFAGSTAAEAHLLQARLRAVATRRPMVRATNLGATAIVDARGRVLARAPPERGAIAVADLPVRRRPAAGE